MHAMTIDLAGCSIRNIPLAWDGEVHFSSYPCTINRDAAIMPA